MIVFILMAIKITATLFSISIPSLVSFSASSIPMLLVWTTDHSSTELFSFKSIAWLALFALYFITWIVTPWLTTSRRSGVAIVGLSFVLGSNLFDIISCMLSALTIFVKTLSLSFSALIILLSLRTICKTVG
jgi:hypothetical protein